jgi:uncharacterized protein with PIN domain
MGDTYSIFISHAAVDREIAIALKDKIRQALPAHKIFVSSDPEDLNLGDEWVPKILDALKEAKFVIVLATSRGLTRKWVWFEAGRTWFSGVPMLPCCVGEIRKENLPTPFSGRMSANLDDARDAELLFKRLEECFEPLAETPDYNELAHSMTRLDVRAEEREKINQDPFANEMLKDIDRQMKTLNSAQRETIRQYVIYGDLTTTGAKQKARDAGADMEKWSVPQHLTNLTGWLVPSPGNSPHDDMQYNLFSINPKVRPLLQDYFARQQ